jgi:hypothetical protein
MTRVPATLVLIVSGLIAAPAALAQSTNRIAGIVVDSGPPPAVQSSYPAPGGKVPAGVMILKIVFDKPMTPDAWAYGPVAGAAYPDCLAHPRLLSDQRTFVLLCTVPTSHAFALQINAVSRFATDYGRPATPYTLQFSTTDDVTEELDDALKQAGLTHADDPIMTAQAAVQGVSQTAPPQ